jgi:hypothetical protein
VRLFLLLLLLAISPTSSAFDPGVVRGQWAVYASNPTSGPDYYFLQFNSDLSGVLIRSFGGEETRRSFSATDVEKKDGYLEVRLSPSEKAVLSAWRLPSGAGKLTGQIFMYNKNGELFNMLYFPLQFLTPDHRFLMEIQIKRLSDEFK